MMSLGYEDLQPILAYLEQQVTSAEEEVRPVSPRKLEYNGLPSSVSGLLRSGMAQTSLVERYFTRTIDKERGTRVASAFRARYLALREQGLDGLAIFDQLNDFARGPFASGATRQVAVYAVLAYLFFTCGIFESPPDDEP